MAKTIERRDQCCLCGKTKEQVRKLIVGLHGAVCSDCIDLCNDILHNDPDRPAPQPSVSGAPVSGTSPSPSVRTSTPMPTTVGLRAGMTMKPKEIVDYLDTYVVGQQLAKKSLAVAV